MVFEDLFYFSWSVYSIDCVTANCTKIFHISKYPTRAKKNDFNNFSNNLRIFRFIFTFILIDFINFRPFYIQIANKFQWFYANFADKEIINRTKMRYFPIYLWFSMNIKRCVYWLTSTDIYHFEIGHSLKCMQSDYVLLTHY